MKLLVIETKKSKQSELEHEYLKNIFKDKLNIDLQIDYVIEKDVLDRLVVEDGYIKHTSIYNDYGYDWVHLRLTDRQWKKLKLATNLYGEYHSVRKSVVTYGRWSEKAKFKQAQNFYHEFPMIPEHVVGMVHEYSHSKDGNISITHTYFYGYDKLYSKAREIELKPLRYAQKPSMLKALEWIFKKSIVVKKVEEIKTIVLNNTTYKPAHFKNEEIKNLDIELVKMLDKARTIAGIPFMINSGFRTAEHNKKVGGVANSAHLTGKAVDLRATNNSEIFTIVNASMQAGFKRIGINWDSKFVHIDIDNTKPNPTIYKY